MSYFAVVKREMIDMVPKAITLTLVNHAKENLQRELLEHLYKPDVLEELLKESPDVVARSALSFNCLAVICVCVEGGKSANAACISEQAVTDCIDGASASRWSVRSTRPKLSWRPSRVVKVAVRSCFLQPRCAVH